MTAVFSYDAQTGPQYVNLTGIAAGYGIVSVPVGGFLPGDQVQTVALTIIGTGLTTIQLAVDMVQRSGGFYEWTDASSIDAHFSITNAQIAAIAAATNCTYSVVIMILRNGVQETREVQAGKIAARPALPTPPLIVNSVVVTGGPVSGTIGQQAQLTGTAYDGLGNALPSATITWTSSNTNVATIDATGKVTFVTPGVAVIVATSQGVSASTTATCSTGSIANPTDKQSLTYSVAQASWLPTTLAAAYLSIAAGALLVGGGWPAGASELAPGAAAGYVRSNGTAWVRSAGVPAADVTAGTFGTGAYTFPSSVTITNGLSVNAGTSALQALTATTGVFSSSVSAASFSGPLSGNATTATALATGRTIAITGDLAYTSPAFDGSGNVTAAGTLATVNPNVGSFGSSTAIPTFTVNGKGLITAAATTVVVAPAGTLTGTTLASNVVTSSLTSVGVLASPHMTGAVVDSGGFTVTSGSTSLQALTVTTFHATSTSALDGAVTVGSTLTFTAAASQVIPGATSYSLRNTANSADNWIVLDAGSGTLRGALAIGGAFSGATTGGFSGIVTASGFTLSAAVGKIIPGATSVAFRDTADANNNLLITDAGAITVRSTISGITTLTATTLAGTLSTPAQPNVTSVGTLTGLTVGGNVHVTSGGITVDAGTTGVQAITATTGVFSSTLQSAGFTATTGTFSSTVAVAGDFAIATTKFTVASATGNTVVAGTLGVSGVSTFAAVNGTTGAFSGAVSTVGLSSSSGFTVSSGTSSVVALTASGLISGSAGLSISSGTSALQALTTTTIAATGAVTVTSASANSIAVGPNGTTNPAWQVDSSTASQAAGLKLTGATAAGTVALAVISSGAAANLSINALGTGTIAIGNVSTGAVTITPATTISGAFNVNGNFTVSTAGALSGITTIATSGAINSQTISSAANFTGSLTVASGFTVSAGTSAVQALTATTGAFTGAITATTGSFSISANSFQLLSARNTNAGAAAAIALYLGNDASAFTGTIEVMSSAYTPTSYYVADGVALFGNRTGGLVLGAANASGTVRIWSGGALAVTFGTSQQATFAGTIASSVSANSFQLLQARNTNNGAAAGCALYLGNDSSAFIGTLEVTSSAYTPASYYVADGTYLFGNRAGGLVVGSSNGSATTRIWSAGALVATFDTNQRVVFQNGLAVSGATAPSNGIAFGTSAPGTLADGQLWYDGTNFKARTGGVTKTVSLV